MSAQHNESIKQWLKQRPTEWFTSGEIYTAFPHISKPTFYLAISNMTLKDKTLTRRRRLGGGGNEYQLTEIVGKVTPPAEEATSTEPTERVRRYTPPPNQAMREALTTGLANAATTIEWSEEDKLAVAAEYVKVKSSRTWLNQAEAMREAQKVLPVHKQYRTPVTKDSFPWFDDYIQKAVFNTAKGQRNGHPASNGDQMRERVASAALSNPRPSGAIPDPKAPSRPVITVPDRDPTVERRVAERRVEAQPVKTEDVHPAVTAPPAPSVSVADIASNVMMEELSKRITEAGAKILKQIVLDVFSSPEVRAALTVNVNVNVNHVSRQKDSEAVAPSDGQTKEAAPEVKEPPHQQVVRHDPEPTPSDKPKLKRILIGGLLNAQISEIKNEFGDVLDLKFWKSDESMSSLKSRSTTADVVIMVYDFVKAAAGVLDSAHINYIKHHGGMTKLKDLLTEIYVSDDK